MTMDKHEKFTAWAVQRGVEIQGIAAHKWEGRGVGIRAERNIKAGETILKVPASALRHAKTVPTLTIARPLGKITIHGLLATDLVLDTSPIRQPWRDVLPTRSDFQETHPMTWPPALQALLPPAAQTLLKNQNLKFDLDWSTVSNAFPTISKEDYHYAWLIVNTRTFYWLFPNAKKKLATDDCMALNPFADYFNHAASGCNVDFSERGFTVVADRGYEVGEEIYISYGSHSNDFLLAEYGFIMDWNKWDCVSLDECVLESLNETQKEKLKEEGFLGGYVLDRVGVCFRTQVALRVGILSANRWGRFVEGIDDGEKEQAKVDEVLRGSITGYLTKAEETLTKIRDEKAGLASQRATLEKRWLQITALLNYQLERLQ